MAPIYLASPYSVKQKVSETQAAIIRKRRFEKVCKYAAKLMKEGELVFCPIAHSHPIEVIGMPGEVNDGDFWLKQDFAVLQFCKELRVLMMDGWEQSSGVQREIEFAHQLNIPVSYVEDVTDKRNIKPRATEERLAA